MRATAVVEVDPVANHTTGVLQGLKSVTVDALLFQRPDDALDHAVLLRTVRRDEFLLQPIAANQAREVAAREDQSVIRSQKERLGDASQRAEPADQGLFQRRFRGCRFATSR